MRIVLTNDDGYEAPGLAALWKAVRDLPDTTVEVIAPAEAHSGKGHAVNADIICRRVRQQPMSEILVVEGTPADCVRVAVYLPDRPPPDLILAGINRGSNLGVDVYYSGTVAAAREAHILGVPSMAISQFVRSALTDDWPRATAWASAVISAVYRPDVPPPAVADPAVYRETLEALSRAVNHGHRPCCWNVNLPSPDHPDDPVPVRLATLSTDPLSLAFEHLPTTNDSSCLTYVGKYYDRPATPGTDVAVLFSGCITLTSLNL